MGDSQRVGGAFMQLTQTIEQREEETDLSFWARVEALKKSIGAPQITDERQSWIGSSSRKIVVLKHT